MHQRESMAQSLTMVSPSALHRLVPLGRQIDSEQWVWCQTVHILQPCQHFVRLLFGSRPSPLNVNLSLSAFYLFTNSIIMGGKHKLFFSLMDRAEQSLTGTGQLVSSLYSFLYLSGRQKSLGFSVNWKDYYESHP